MVNKNCVLPNGVTGNCIVIKSIKLIFETNCIEVEYVLYKDFNYLMSKLGPMHTFPIYYDEINKVFPVDGDGCIDGNITFTQIRGFLDQKIDDLVP